MYKFGAAIRKEMRQLFADRVGLMVMFFMPLMLVFVITIVQDSAYRVINDNVITILISNQDEGEQGEFLVESLNESGLFNIIQKDVKRDDLKEQMSMEDQLTALYIPNEFSASLEKKGSNISAMMMSAIAEEEISKPAGMELPQLLLTYDPILQEQYTQTVVNVIMTHVEMLQSKIMIDAVFADVGLEHTPTELDELMVSQKAEIIQQPAMGEGNTRPNSSQHNVPAWTIFAMFFMVVGLGGNVVREKASGSFLRLKSTPTSLNIILTAKMLVYVCVGILQVVVIFGVAALTFPSIGLPEVNIPSNFAALFTVVLLSSFAAVSFAMVIGSYATSQVQANGIGAVSVIIFASLGGVWVPTFVMPDYLQTISMFSPLNWCLEGFYTLFLRGGSWGELFQPMLFTVIFILVCQSLMLTKMKVEKLI